MSLTPVLGIRQSYPVTLAVFHPISDHLLCAHSKTSQIMQPR